MRVEDSIFRARDGNNQAIAELIDTYSPLVRKFAFQLGNNLEAADTITEEVFIRMFRFLDFVTQEKFTVWLYKITLNVSADFSQQPQGRFNKLMAMRKKRSEAVIFASEEDRIVHEYIQSLEEKERIAIVLFYLHDLSYEEIADIAGVSNSYVTAHLSTGKEKIMKSVAGKNDSYLYDELFLEHTLEKLKRAYENIPASEYRSEILAAIKKDKKGANKRRSLPFALSLLGIGMLSGAVMMQLIDDSGIGATKQTSALVTADADAITAADVKATFDTLEELHAKKVEEARKKLGLPKDQIFVLSQFIGFDIKGIKTSYLEQLAGYDHDDLKQTKKEYQMMIENGLTVPADVIAAMKKGSKVENTEFEFQLFSQLEMYQNVYWQMNTFFADWRTKKGLEDESAASFVKKLNTGGKEINNKQLKALAAGAKKNGYRFIEENGVVTIQIDYRGIIRQLGSKIGKDYRLYLDFRSNRIYDEQGNVRSYNDLGEFLVKSERDLAAIEDQQIKDMMRNELQSYYAAFVQSMPGRLFDEHNFLKKEVRDAYQQIISNHPKTTTAASVKKVYDDLAATNFEKPADFDHRSIDFPEHLGF